MINQLQQANKVWQGSNDKETIIGDSKYKTIDAKIKLFREVCDFYAKNKRFVFKSDEAKAIVNNLFLYCNLQDGKYDITRGLYIHGSVGSGKSTLLKIAKDYSNKLYPRPRFNNLRPKRPDEMWMLDEMRNYLGGFSIVNTTQVCNSYKLEQKGENSLEKYFAKKEICFDEFGREPIPVMNYGTKLNVMQYILELRYDNWNNSNSLVDKLKTRTHITTNTITGNNEEVDLSGLCEKYEPYIADRIRDMCNIIHLDETSFRQ